MTIERPKSQQRSAVLHGGLSERELRCVSGPGRERKPIQIPIHAAMRCVTHLQVIHQAAFIVLGLGEHLVRDAVTCEFCCFFKQLGRALLPTMSAADRIGGENRLQRLLAAPWTRLGNVCCAGSWPWRMLHLENFNEPETLRFRFLAH